VKITVHVLVAWPKGSSVDDAKTKGIHVTPDTVLTYVDHGNDDSALKFCYQVAERYKTVGHAVDIVTVQVDSERANPTSLASAIALQQLGHTPSAVEGLLRRAAEDQVRQVTTLQAAEYLEAQHNLHVNPTNMIRGQVLLHLARRARCGDPFAALALAELADELTRLDEAMPIGSPPPVESVGAA
jgi:hypothetical protein